MPDKQVVETCSSQLVLTNGTLYEGGVLTTNTKPVGRDFLGGPMVETLSSNTGGCEFNPRSGSYNPTCLGSTPKTPKHRARAIL